MTDPPGPEPASPDAADDWAPLVPELLVTDLSRSLAFWVGACGFALRFTRPEDGFAYLTLGRAQVMLEQVSDDAWLTGPLTPPFGRGINLQIEVADAPALHDCLRAAGVALFRGLSTDWYREGGIEHGQMQILVQDPDGYLLRFVQPLGTRPVGGDS
jgi:catechol 2,3-dioxygenase-like lactoylglutathione lyase family enzyme